MREAAFFVFALQPIKQLMLEELWLDGIKTCMLRVTNAERVDIMLTRNTFSDFLQ